MPSIIDSLVVLLNLDSKGFVKGAKEGTDASNKMRDTAVDNAKRQEEAQKKVADGLRSVRNETLGLVLAMAGASSIKGFFTQMVDGDAATGRLANNLNVAVGSLSAYEMAIKRVGGASGDADSAFQAMVNIRENAELRGDHSQYAVLNRLGVTDLKAGPEAAFMQMAKTAETMDKPTFVNLASSLGLNANFINLLEKGRTGLQAYIDKAKAEGAETKANAEAAQALNDALADLENTMRSKLRPEVYMLATVFTDLSKGVNKNTEAMPILIGIVGSLGVAATLAAAPWLALAAAITAAYEAYHAYQNYQNMSPSDQASYDQRRLLRRDAANAALMRGDIMGALGIWKSGLDDLEEHGGAKPSTPSGVVGGATGTTPGKGQRGTFDQIVAGLVAQGIPEAQARGVAAWSMAESSGRTGAFNSAGGGQGAFGIGQWRGARQRRLRERYGANPTLGQQVEFMAWELHGGDPGGAAALRSGGDAATLAATARYFGRGSASDNAGDYRRGLGYLGRPVAATRAASGGGAAASSGGTTVNVGPVTVHSNAQDGHGLARDFQRSLERRGVAIQAQSGMTP